ncbi:hypothetical protein AO262_25895 [Pseudomonas fluorescens ABAC62]|nr:hypothetical protein AO262_25895 [Pseudomonas fluorescens ABAC62]
MIMRASEEFLAWDILKAKLQGLLDAVDQGDYALVRHLLKDVVSGYSPEGDIVDWMHIQRQRDH